MAFDEDIVRPGIFCTGRTIYFYENIDNYTVLEVVKHIQALEAKSITKPIRLIIHSEGGNVYSGLSLYDRLKISPCKIITVGTGFVASMGLIAFLAGDERVITPNTILLNHQPYIEYGGKADDIEIEAQETVRLKNLIIRLVSGATKQPPAKIREDVKRGDKYISAAEALTLGYAHKMIEYHEKKRKQK